MATIDVLATARPLTATRGAPPLATRFLRIVTISATGTYTPSADCIEFAPGAIGGGGGGASGACGSAESVLIDSTTGAAPNPPAPLVRRPGGTGGEAGSVTMGRRIPKALVQGTVSVTVGLGGTGGLSVKPADMPDRTVNGFTIPTPAALGKKGADGGATTITIPLTTGDTLLIRGEGGLAAEAGTLTLSGLVRRSALSRSSGGLGAPNLLRPTAVAGEVGSALCCSPGAGGGGGGLDTTDGLTTGGSGTASVRAEIDGTMRGTPNNGGAGGGAGGAGAASTDTAYGTGGGGGGGNPSAAAGTGGAGGTGGGGGGGGGASRRGFDSGAGGRGGNGLAVFYEYGV